MSPIKDSTNIIIGASRIGRDITEHERALRSLARRMEEQAALYQFTNKLFRAASVDEVYDGALDGIMRALVCDRASILMFDDTDVMKFVAWRALSDGYREALQGRSPWTRETREREPLLIRDVDSAELEPMLRAAIKDEGIGALAFIPMIAKGEVMVVVCRHLSFVPWLPL